MNAPLEHLDALLRRSQRRSVITLLAILVPALCALVIVARAHDGRGMVPAVLGFIALSVWAWPRVFGAKLKDRAHATQRLDAAFPQLEDSSALLLQPEDTLSPLARLQKHVVVQAFAPLAHARRLTQALPPVAARTLGTSWMMTLVFSALILTALAPRDDLVSANAIQSFDTLLREAQVTLSPPAYLGLPERTVDTLNLSTVEDAQVRWSVQLALRAQIIALHFHDGEIVELQAAAGGRWFSEPWPARSTVYTIHADEVPLPNAVFKIDAQPDQTPRLDVRAPTQSLRLLDQNDPAPVQRLAFEAFDDHQVVAANARVTLARGGGEQVQFREQAIALDPVIADNGRSLSANVELDLLALGMQRGDELYLFAEVSDNKPEPNVGASGTYIIRWPDDEVAASEPIVTIAMDELPEFFRSQRQIIIDTEALIRERSTLDERVFAQRAQTLAVDQKLLRLRYGQYLGEETDSGIGAAAERRIAQELARREDDGDEDHSDHDDHDDHAGHDHAGHDEAPGGVADMAFGDRQAAMDLYTHFHDTAEQATLFEPETRSLLQQALAQMWDAELQLRLFDPDQALPYEYAALDFIKRVQQSSRIYLRRAGFRPTPIDESRRLTGELEDIRSGDLNGNVTDGEYTQLRRLFEHLASGEARPDGLRPLVDTVTALVRTRSAGDPTWLGLLAELQRVQSDASCAACRQALRAAIWQQLSPARVAPAPATVAPHPLARAYEQRLNNAGLRP